MKKVLTYALLGFAITIASSACSKSNTSQTASSGAVSYASAVKPIFEGSCYNCHGGGDKLRGELDLAAMASAMKGGGSGPVIIAGDSAASVLIQVVEGTHPDIDKMPAKGDPLTDAQIATLKSWIDEGANWSN
jgi:mono/diheme cytochrome c family protein